jgi:hypothetical protein
MTEWEAKWHDSVASEFSSMLSNLMMPQALGPSKKKLQPQWLPEKTSGS